MGGFLKTIMSAAKRYRSLETAAAASETAEQDTENNYNNSRFKKSEPTAFAVIIKLN